MHPSVSWWFLSLLHHMLWLLLALYHANSEVAYTDAIAMSWWVLPGHRNRASAG